MHIQSDLIEQQCETSGPADYFTISAFLLSRLALFALTVTHHSLVVVVIQSEGLIWSLFMDWSLLSDVAVLQPGTKSENGFHMLTLSGSLSHSEPHPACSECHQRKPANRQTEEVSRSFKAVLY